MQFLVSTLFAVASLRSLGADAQSITPSSVDKSTRQFWCQSQITQCPLICLQLPGQSSSTRSNTCDPETLNFSCVCASGQSPNASEYSQTIPYFTCTQFNTNCVNACGGNSACQSACRENHPCGAQDPKRVNTSTQTSTMSATGTNAAASTGSNGVVYTGLGGAAATSSAGGSGGATKPNAGSLALDLAQSYGLAAVIGGLFAGFALIL